ncbi:hypothetical protein [Methanosarcina barkeri]|uniref:hypothetical protein n=1 Tax=Methanosarcina barkeri TaxID=2208 RepID=UPI001FB23D87|nr:hypothetical protein [Methanosarcina barkeri]
MRQRLIACMSLSFEPELVIADEPTKGWTPRQRKEQWSFSLRLKKEYGKTMLLITHDLDLALEVCDRIAVMYAGEIVELDEASKVLNTPSHPYTKAYSSSTEERACSPERAEPKQDRPS